MEIKSNKDLIYATYVKNNLSDLYISKDYRSEILSKNPDDIAILINNVVSLKNSNISSWHLKLELSRILGPEILCNLTSSKLLDPAYHCHLLKNGFYKNFEIFDDICLDKEYSEETRKFCSNYCEVKTLKKLTDDDCKDIRGIAYSRLGLKYSINLMQEDSSLDNRQIAASFTPALSKDMNIFVNDRSKKILSIILDKIPLSKVLFLLGNKNIKKDKKLSDKISSRLKRNV